MTCYSKGFSFYTEKKKTTKTREEFGSGSGSGSEPDKGSGSGSQTGSEGKEKSGIETSGSHEEKPTKSKSNGASGAGLDQEESGDESPTEQGSGKESSGGYAGGESDDGSFETWEPGNRMKKKKTKTKTNRENPVLHCKRKPIVTSLLSTFKRCSLKTGSLYEPVEDAGEGPASSYSLDKTEARRAEKKLV